MESEHTLGPWKLSKTQVVKCSVYDHDGKPIAHCDRRGSETSANAAFIVKACNAYDALLAAVQETKELITSGNWEVDSYISNLDDSLDYALAKVKGVSK